MKQYLYELSKSALRGSLALGVVTGSYAGAVNLCNRFGEKNIVPVPDSNIMFYRLKEPHIENTSSSVSRPK